MIFLMMLFIFKIMLILQIALLATNKDFPETTFALLKVEVEYLFVWQVRENFTCANLAKKYGSKRRVKMLILL